MVDLRRRMKQRGEASSSASEADQIAETIHLTLKAGASVVQDTACSSAAPAAPEVAVQSVAVSAPVAVPQPCVSRKEAVAMELCKPTGAPGAAPALRTASAASRGVAVRAAEHAQGRPAVGFRPSRMC